MNIKGMDKNMQCRGFQFEIGKEYKIDRDGRPLKLCSSTVFHYCKSLSQVHGYYDCNKENNRYFEIEVLGEEVTDGGNWNSGVANKCNYSNGAFCNESDNNIRIFNKPSGMSLGDFYRSRYWDAMCSAPFCLTEWIYYTQEEKEVDPRKELIGGYLKVYTLEEAWANWWAKLDDENREIIKEIPNFDAEIFKDITGIEV